MNLYNYSLKNRRKYIEKFTDFLIKKILYAHLCDSLRYTNKRHCNKGNSPVSVLLKGPLSEQRKKYTIEFILSRSKNVTR